MKEACGGERPPRKEPEPIIHLCPECGGRGFFARSAPTPTSEDYRQKMKEFLLQGGLDQKTELELRTMTTQMFIEMLASDPEVQYYPCHYCDGKRFVKVNPLDIGWAGELPF